MSSPQNGFMSLYKLPLRDERRSASFNFFLPFNMPTSATKSPLNIGKLCHLNDGEKSVLHEIVNTSIFKRFDLYPFYSQGVIEPINCQYEYAKAEIVALLCALAKA